jgi:DNA-binding NtrC family response regulator
LRNIEKLVPEMQRELVGVLRTHAQSFRLICTSGEDLERLTEEGRFDDELFYRVASLPVALPPLRDRPEDIPVLVKFFSSQASNPHFDPKLIEFSPEAIAVLEAHPWHGNVTELAQLVGKIAGSTEKRVVGAEQLPQRVRDLEEWPKLADYLALQEKHYVDQVLHACRGDKARAARVLGVDLNRLG